MKRIQDIFAVRVLLEAEAARLAAGRVDAEQLRNLDALCSAGYDPDDPESVAHFLTLNREIHVAVARASGNERLASTLSQLLDDMERIFHFALKLRDQSLQIRHEHRTMVDALVLGEGVKAAEIVAEQVLAGQRMVTAALQATPQLMSVSLEVPA
ncbi:MAG: FCD domain-containing protein [Candidatus Limnocylindria bacterium]